MTSGVTSEPLLNPHEGSPPPRSYGSTDTSPAATPPPSVAADAGSRVLAAAVVNPMSGERAAAAGMANAVTARLGADRVILLDSAAFADPVGLGRRIRAVVGKFPSPAAATDRREATGIDAAGPAPIAPPKPTTSILVAGGDGTVSFVMSVLDAAFDAAPAGAAHVAKPAVAVLAMGTGNDLSISLGFGGGFTANSGCWCCCCCPRSIDRLLSAALAAPLVAMDRWEVVVTRPTRPHPSPAVAGPALLDASLSGGVPRVSPVTPGSPENFNAFVSASTLNNDGGDGSINAALGSHRSSSGGAEAVLLRTPMNNYCSFGMDADISARFDAARRRHPALHRSRAMNKLWYGAHGLAAACGAASITNENVALSLDGAAVPLPRAADGGKALVISNVPSYAGGVDLWHFGKAERRQQEKRREEAALRSRDMSVDNMRAAAAPPAKSTRGSALKPSGSQSSRTPPAASPKGGDRRAASAAAGGRAGGTPVLRGVSIADGVLEVQTTGGLAHSTLLQLGATGASRVGQGAAVEVVINNRSRRSKAVEFALQVDGEPHGRFAAPLRLTVRRLPVGPTFVHCDTPQ
jgi:hypothetical protein